MEREVSIILSREDANYRKLAKSHYGLTEEQMEGKHVHHNPPRYLGGRNVPEHLYVYSIENHEWVHSGDPFVSASSKGSVLGGSANTPLQKESRRRVGRENGKRNSHHLDKYRSENGKKWGEANKENLRGYAGSNKKAVEVTNLKTGEKTYWESAREAARNLGLCQSHLSRTAREPKRQHKGYRARYIG